MAQHLTGALDGTAWNWVYPETRLKFNAAHRLEDQSRIVSTRAPDGTAITGQYPTLEAFITFLRQMTGKRGNHWYQQSELLNQRTTLVLGGP